MIVSALDRKLLRDLVGLRAQVLTIAGVVACGVATFVALRATWTSLADSQALYYDQSRFADVFDRLERAPDPVIERLRAIPGVATVETRIVRDVMVPMDDLPEPAHGRIVSLPDVGEPLLDVPAVEDGRLPAAGRSDEALVLSSFAVAHQLALGDRVPVVLNGKLERPRVVGLASSPEYLFAAGGGADFLPDERRFAVLWMNRAAIAPAFEMDGAFDDVTIRVQPGASLPAVLEGVDRVLARYGGYGAYGRDKQPSYAFVTSLVERLDTLAVWAPALFLFVSAFLLNVVLSRLVFLQRGEIAALKALGYGSWRVGLHYLELVAVIALLGVVVGTVVGSVFGVWLSGLYGHFFHIPLYTFHLAPSLVAGAAAISFGSAIVGALGAVRSVVRLPPAEAMRPPAPLVYRVSFLERLGVDRALGTSGRMVLRELQRRPLRFALSAVGVGLAVALLVVGRYSSDSFEGMIDVIFRLAWREDVTVSFVQPLAARAVRDLAHEDGVLLAEGQRIVAVRFRHRQHVRDGAIYGYPDGGDLRRVLDRDMHVATLPRTGVMLSAKLAEILEVAPGDSIDVDVREGDRRTRPLRVTSVVDDSFGLLGYARGPELARWLGEEERVTAVLLRLDPSAQLGLLRRTKRMPAVLSVSSRDATIARFREQAGRSMSAMTTTLTLFAIIVTIGVVYNNARSALSLRARDLASLRVLGMTRREISVILLGELAAQVVTALPLGCVMGTLFCWGLLHLRDPEQYRMPLVILPRTYAFAVAVTVLSGLASALLVRRKLDRLDLVAVLKERE